MKNIWDTQFNQLKNALSTDATRDNLTSPIACIIQTEKYLASTDGHRLYAMKFDHKLEKTQNIFLDAIQNHSKILVLDESKPPEISRLVPTEFKTKMRITIPTWFKLIKPAAECILCFNSDNSFSTKKQDNTLFGVNAGYLRLLAGQELFLFCNGPLSPTVFSSDENNPLASDDFNLIMPARV